MRLHRLEIEAFGPFGGHEVVDFDALSDSGLFLLSGPTGAGKTSVLDAVCFALFGEVPGARGDANRLASDHRDPAATPRVTLEATVGGRRIRVVRVPKHLRPAKKGGGAPVKDDGSAVLELADPAADGGWRAVAAKIPEVRRELDPLLGMTAEQFLQVVMLPQGAFATFLRADAKARREVLERLFDAGRFSKIELWLQDRAREARQAVERQQIAADNALAEAGGAWIACGAAPLLREGATVAEIDEWLTAERERLAAARDDALAARDAAQAALSAVERERDAARERAGLQQRRRDAEARLAAIETEADAHAERVDRLRAHRQAVPLRGYLSTAAAARAAAADSARTIEKARKWIEQLEDDGLSADPATWAAGARSRATAVAELGELVQQEAGLAMRQGELQRLRGEAQAAAERVRTSEQRLERVAAAEAALEARRVAADAATADVARLEEQARSADRRAAAGERRDALVVDEQRAAEAVRAAVDAHQRAVDVVQRLRQARLDGYAAELAAGLAPDGACPVCGSVEHPSPASPADGHVTADEERAASDAAADAQQVREAAERRQAEVRSALAVARSEARGEPDAATSADPDPLVAASATAAGDAEPEAGADIATSALRRAADEVRARLTAAQAAAADGRHVADERRRLLAQQQADQAAVTEAREAVARLTAQADGAAVELERLQVRIAEARDGFPDVAARVRALEHQATFLEKATSAHDADVAARDALQKAEVALADALAEHELPDADAAIAAILTPKDVGALEAEIRRVDEARAAAQGVLASPEIAAVTLEPAVDVAAVEARRSAAAEAAEQAANRAAAAARCADAEASRRDALRAQLDGLAPLREAADRAHALAELARGGVGNQRKIQLSSWVLAARLEQVAAAATVHLLEMSSGRYRLVLHEEAASARGKGNAGLGLRVLDGWTGEERDTTTLSGGESFFASLSLALGLAETVTAEAGGLDLGTLFIDEGFGSLDEQTLEDVLEQIDKLRDGGRAVGIVSHVPELKQRIPVQLIVEKARDGSRLRQAVGAVG